MGISGCLRAAALGAAVLSGGAVPAFADPALGFGVSLIFGKGGEADVAMGLRVFSDDRSERAVASVGVDFVMKAQRVRPTVGVAYLKGNGYVGADLGFDFDARRLDYSVGLGVTDSRVPVAPNPVVVVNPGGGGGGGVLVGGGGTDAAKF